jgi:hypothetical protein
MSRNQYMMLGTALLLLGITIYKVENVTLTEQTTRFVAQQMGTIPEDGNGVVAQMPVPKKTVPVPPWLRFLFVSVGVILMLHAVAMKPSG